jgi:glycosyltransferase involved in cell wall biosynthesis
VDSSQYPGVTLKIVINAVSAKMGGAVTYLTNILRRLPPPESGYEFDVFTPPEAAERQEGLPGNVRLVATSIGQAAWWKRFWWEQVTLRDWLKRRKADVLFSTANFGMFHCPVRQILLVRNALYFSKIYQDEFLPRHSLRFQVPFKFRRWLICRSVRQADVVMTPTQAMLDDLRRFVEVEPWKSLVNPYGSNPTGSFLREAKGKALQSPAGTTPVMRLIYVSLYSEHKNLATLLRAMPLVNRNGARKFALQTTVNPGWEGGAWTLTHNEDLALARQPDVAPWVEFLGPLGQQQIQQLYREGDLFVFPSLCESFGHPMVEAMAEGLPIVASDTPVNRELCGDAAVYFSPLSAEDLAQQVRALAQAPALLGKLGAAGRERAAKLFMWDEHARRILECAGGAKEETPHPLARD